MSDDEEAFHGKPGQKHPTPTPGNGDRVFYETLLKQRPESEMAREWCLQYGIFDEETAKKEYKAMEKRKASSKSPKREKSSSSSTDKKKKKKVKKVLDDVEFDAGMDAGGGDGIGIAGL